jgi:hypothetical protein
MVDHTTLKAGGNRCTEAALGRWPEILPALTGIDPALLDGKPHGCPICREGTDRFTFDNRDGRGTWICRQCPARAGKDAGAGDGMALLQAIKGWGFRQAVQEIERHLGLASQPAGNGCRPLPSASAPTQASAPPAALPAVPQGLIQLLRLPNGAPDVVLLEQPGPIVQLRVGEDLVEHFREAVYRYGPTQEVWRLMPVAGGKKLFQARFVASGRWIAKQGPVPWQLWRGNEAIAAVRANPGHWLLETEGEKAAEIAREGGLAAVSQPGHAHKLDQIQPRYAALVAAGVGGVVFLADMDMTGLKRAQAALDAAAAEGLPLVVLPGSKVWPTLPEGGSIDDAPGTPADRVAALEEAVSLIDPAEWAGIWAKWRQAMGLPASEPEAVVVAAAAASDGAIHMASTYADLQKSEQVGAPPIDKWESAIRSMLNPEHPNHEKNTIRRQIRAATLAAELSLRVSPTQARERIQQIQRAMLNGDTPKGTAGGDKARITEKQWLVDGLIAKGCLTGIAAFNKVGKTKMAARLAADLIFGRSFLGRFPVAPGHHRIVLWWVDQPAADSAAYLRAVNLMKPDGTLHPQIVSLYTEEDDLAWDDAGADLLLEHAGKEPGLVLITDSFFHSIQRIYGSDQEPEAGGALIDIQTLLAPYGVTHICLFHSPKDTGPNGIQAIRGHGSAGGAVSACISLHFMEKRCPMKKIWIADKDNPHRRMVVEGRAPFQDLLIRGDWADGTFKVIGEYQKAIAELLADEGKAQALDGLTDARRQVVEVIGGTSGVDGATLLQIAQGVHGTSEPTHRQKETIRHQCLAMVKHGLLRRKDLHGRTFFSIAPGVLTG